MTLLPAPAHAGHWVFTTTGSGQSTLNGSTQRTYTAPSTTTNNSVSMDYALAASGSSGPGTGTGTPVTYKATSDLTLTVKAVWTADGSSDNTAPPNVVMCENTTATGSFSNNGGPQQASTQVDDGFQDPVAQSGSNIGTSAKVHYVPLSGGTVTATLTASVTSTGKSGASGGTGVGASIGPITISIHAQPYGWYDAGHLENGVFVAGPHMDNTTGELAFNYGWLSTSGSLSDLKNITIYEIVDYSGTPGTMSADKKTFYPQSPPVTSGYNVFNGKAGSPFDASRLYAHDVHSAFPTVSPLQPLAALTWTIPQKYEFDDPATGEVGTVLKDEGNIVDMLKINPNQFTVSKSGFTATKPL